MQQKGTTMLTDKAATTIERLRNSAESILDELAQLREEYDELEQAHRRALELGRLRADIRRATATVEVKPVPARERNTGRQDKWTRQHMTVISGKLSAPEARRFAAACNRAGVSAYSVLNQAARDFTAHAETEV
jgi:hypothetical protein